jgi:hypothetical protein
MMEVPTMQEKSEQIFFAQPKAHQFEFVDTKKSSQKKRRWLIFWPHIAANQATNSIVATSIITTTSERQIPDLEKFIVLSPIEEKIKLSSVRPSVCKEFLRK